MGFLYKGFHKKNFEEALTIIIEKLGGKIWS